MATITETPTNEQIAAAIGWKPKKITVPDMWWRASQAEGRGDR